VKTVYIINSLEGGGAERVFAQLISLLAGDEAQHDKPLVVLLDKLDEVYSLPEGAEVHRIGRRGGGIGVLLQYLALLRLLAKLKPDLIVSFLTRANIMNVCSAKLLGSQSIISERSNTSARLANRYARAKGWVVSLVEKSAAEESAASVGIVAMGRLVRTKGFSDLILAYQSSGLSCGLSILGDGPERSNLVELVDELELSEQVHFLGFVNNPYQVIKNADLFVLCSHLEGFPNALIEAMALGKPVIATDCTDGPREILALTNNIALGEYRLAEHGLMVNVGDPPALAKAMLYLHQDESLRDELALKAKSRVKQYSKQHFYRSYTELLARLRGDSN